MRELLHIDLFAGASGFPTGLRPGNWSTAVAVEKDPYAAAAFSINHLGVPLLQRDIREVSGGEVAEHLPMSGGRRREADLVTAGCPCQTFSRAGKTATKTFDHRQTMFREVLRIAKATRAKVICLENVREIRDKPISPENPTPVAEFVRRELERAGYTNQVEGILLAADFGVPQNRKRWFLLASRISDLPLRLPEPTGPLVTVGEAFADLGEAGYTGATSPYARLMRDDAWWRMPRPSERPTHHEGFAHAAGVTARYSMLTPGRKVADLLDELDVTTQARLQAHGVLPRVAFKQRGRRLHPGRPSPTVTSHSWCELVHPTRPRGLTVREAARLQSFPDGHGFEGPLTSAYNHEDQDRYEQIGDAVPPLLAWSLGVSLKRMLTGEAEARHPLAGR